MKEKNNDLPQGNEWEEEGGEWPEWIRRLNDPGLARGKPEALDDLLVLDASYAHMGGLVCSSVMAEFGAEVIRIEPPRGDPARRFSPFGILHLDTGLGYLVEGRNKFHITLNLEKGEGRGIFKKLARKADVVLETFKPGTMDRWGIGYRQLSELNARLIYCALNTYGQFGPKAACGKPDYDVTNQALSGAVWSTGEMEDPANPQPYQVPTKIGGWFGWFAGGLWASFGILAALRHRRETGEGQMVDVSGAEAIMRFIDSYLTCYHMAGFIKGRVGPLDSAAFPYTFIRCKDGHTTFVGFSDINFRAITTIMGRPELLQDPRCDSFTKRCRVENQIAIHPILEEWAANYTADEILDKVQDYVLNKRGPGVVATGRVNSPGQTLGEDNWWERGIFQRVEDPAYGELLLQAPPWKMTETPPRIKWACRRVGQDNEYIYLKHLGYGKSHLRELKKKGVI